MHHQTLNKFRRNAEGYINSLTATEYNQAVNWYAEASDYAQTLSLMYPVTYDDVCKVIAVLSPAISWEQNKIAAKKLLNNYYNGTQHTIAGYGANVKKALAILEGTTDLTNKSMKTYAFFRNILTAGKNDGVTVDRHAYKALHNVQAAGSVAVTKTQYKTLEEGYRLLAKEHKLTPPQMQAVIWVGYKKTVGR